MRSQRRSLLLLITLLAIDTGFAQTVRVRDSRRENAFIELRDLHEEIVEVPGIGREVPGLDLLHVGSPVHWIGDDPGHAARELVDSTWSELRSSRDSIVPNEGSHWLRIHLMPETALKSHPLQLNITTHTAFEIFLNGRSLVHSDRMARGQGGADLPELDSVPHMSVPLSFVCDGHEEVLAVHIMGAPGGSVQDAALSLTLHDADVTYVTQRRMMHFGVFVGINVIILLLSLVIWWYERRDRSWLLLALLSTVSALHTVSQVGTEMGMLGLTKGPAQFFHVVDLVLLPWPMYLLIMVLGAMGVKISSRRTRLYTIAAILVTLMCITLLIAEAAGLTRTVEGLTFLDDAPWIIIPGIILVVLFGLIVAWFAVDVVRLGIRLLRTKDHARWIGGGVVASSLLSLLLKIVGNFTGLGLGGWLMVVGDYCSYVAVPVSAAVYLAIRSAHHNRLVARQRDELDAEVRERTAELRTEKERSDELLLNILPHEVAEELKTKGSAGAKHFDHATVLFTDFKGFTRLSEEVGPAELVQELNACFKAFDAIMDHYRIEKIKTIGDSYMAAGGLPDPTHGSPADVVNAALDMQTFMHAHAAERIALGRPHFEMRVGIHTGPVVAGIVGVKKFQYDIWGDTVNTASRMESSGEIGEVNISGATYGSVREAMRIVDGRKVPAFSFTSRGKIQAKGKGELEMYFVRRGPDH